MHSTALPRQFIVTDGRIVSLTDDIRLGRDVRDTYSCYLCVFLIASDVHTTAAH